jgi:hypothetical protein
MLGEPSQPIVLAPGAPGAFACFGTWENIRACMRIDEVDDPLDGCSQSCECRSYTLERNPPTARLSVKPRRDGRFEIQQFRDFIKDHSTYHMDITKGAITITYPGDRPVPKSMRFFLHVKHVEEAQLDVDQDLELIMTLDKMVLRQATEGGVVARGPIPVRRDEDDAEARRKRIAEKLRQRASEAARGRDEDDEELDLELDIDLEELDEDEEGEDEEVEVEPAAEEPAGDELAELDVAGLDVEGEEPEEEESEEPPAEGAAADPEPGADLDEVGDDGDEGDDGDDEKPAPKKAKPAKAKTPAKAKPPAKPAPGGAKKAAKSK